MKGRLKKIGEEWVVTYDVFQDDHSYPFPAYKIIPLHPDDVKQIEEDSKVFDNIEARIAAYPEVEFEIKYYWDGRMEQPIDVAKLIDQETTCEYSGLPSVTSYTEDEYPELEGTNALSEDIIKKRKETLSKVVKLSDESWEGCDGCTEQDEIMYKNGYVKGYNAAIGELPKEISDEEIEKAARDYDNGDIYGPPLVNFEQGAFWYREQLKQKQCNKQ